MSCCASGNDDCPAAVELDSALPLLLVAGAKYEVVESFASDTLTRFAFGTSEFDKRLRIGLNSDRFAASVSGVPVFRRFFEGLELAKPPADKTVS